MRGKIILMLALIMGGITTYLFYDYMKQFDSAAVINENTKEVVVAAQSIKKNQRITTDMIQITQIPEKGIHPQAITKISDVGGYATANIEEGEQILSHRVQNEKEENLFVARKVREGFRGVSVGLNFVQSVSNLIEPEDYVDVVSSIKNEQTKEVETQLILKKVRVLAIGRKMIESITEEEYVEYTSVTLELNPEDSVKLINASERGNIQLTLHTRVIESKGEK